MTLSRFLPAIVALVLVPGFTAAQEKLPDGAKVTKLDVRPAKVELTGPFAYAQLVVTATLDNGETADVTRIATITADPAIVGVNNGLIRAGKNGQGTLAIAVGGQTAKVPLSESPIYLWIER